MESVSKTRFDFIYFVCAARKFFKEFTAQDLPHGSSSRNDRTDFPHRNFPHKDLPHILCTNKSCLNFNKIVFIETIGKKSLKNVRKRFKNVRRIRAEDPVRKILCGKSVRSFRAEDPCTEDPVRSIL